MIDKKEIDNHVNESNFFAKTETYRRCDNKGKHM